MFDLLIYMFENYLSSKPHSDFTNITQELEAAGFDNKEIKSALDWFTQLEKLADKDNVSIKHNYENTIRIFTDNEKNKITTEGLGFILFLEQAHILKSGEREIILDQAMAINQKVISLNEVRWIVMMTLWQNGRENDYLFVEDALYMPDQNRMH
mgnify:CR=1 FL=1|jgi:Smg protein